MKSSSFYYHYKSEKGCHPFDIKTAHTMATGDTWEVARYRIEKTRSKMHDLRQQKANLFHSQLEGYLYQDWLDAGRSRPIPSDYKLKAGDKVVLYRVMLDRNVKPHVPDCVQEDGSIRRWEDMSEEERMAQFFNKKPQNVFVGDSKRVPPPHYVCHRCNIPGHYKQDCPTLQDASFVPRKRTTGIPLSTLRVARPEEEATAYLHSDGRLMVYK